MNALLHIFRRHRKLAVIIGGLLLALGGSGASALYVGQDAIFGTAKTADGLSCTDVNLVTIKKQNRFWIRKYIKTAPTDEVGRVTTALRVAKAIYNAQKPDLVQVVVLDANGPTLQSDIRGRAFGADVLYVPFPEKLQDTQVAGPITARYFKGNAGPDGMFYGDRVDMPEKDAEVLLASLKDVSDCSNAISAKSGDHDSKGGTGGEEKAAEKAPAAESH